VISIKQVFIIVLDNASIHRSKKTREAMKNKHPRIVLVYVPIKAPELNLIEARWWIWMQRIAIAINNSTFENESDIGKAVSDWTKNYNKTHSNTTNHILHQRPIYVCRHI
jgi:transposase